MIKETFIFFNIPDGNHFHIQFNKHLKAKSLLCIELKVSLIPQMFPYIMCPLMIIFSVHHSFVFL